MLTDTIVKLISVEEALQWFELVRGKVIEPEVNDDQVIPRRINAFGQAVRLLESEGYLVY